MRGSAVILALFFIQASAKDYSIRPDYTGLELVRTGAYQSISLPGAYSLSAEGHPDLPWLPVRIALPAGMHVTDIRLTNCEYDTLHSRCMVEPRELRPVGDDSDGRPEPDPEVYRLDRYYPETSLQHWNSGALWGQPMASCWLQPLQWNPSTGELRLLSSAMLQVDLSSDARSSRITARTTWSEEESMRILSSLVINPQDIGGSGAALVDPGDLEFGQYMIITVPEYQDVFQALADWKTSKGVPAEVCTTDWIESRYPACDLQRSIRAFLTDCITEGVDYVLLAGDNDVLEARFTCPGEPALEPLPSDLYFADNNDLYPGEDLWDSNRNGIWGEQDDEVDWHPDIWVGRASVNSTEEAEIFVDKVMIYEQVPNTLSQAFSDDWRESIGFTTGYLIPGGGQSGSAYAESISVMVPVEWDQVKCYESTGTNSTPITISMIDQGHGHIFHANHGAPTEMYTAYGDLFTVSDIMELQNISGTGAVSIWTTIACSCGAFDTLTCCADAWLSSPEGGGFGVFNARATYISYAVPICMGFFDVYLNMGFPYMGIAHGMSLDLLSPPVNGAFVQMSNLFGDPELPMWIAPAGSLHVTHAATYDGLSFLEFEVVDELGYPVEGARICLQQGDWKTGRVYEVIHTDPAGTASVWVDPDQYGEISITVWSHDHYTYRGTIESGTLAPPPECRLNLLSNPSSTPLLLLELDQDTDVFISIYDLHGRAVWQPVNTMLQSGRYEYPIGGLPSGMYMAMVRMGEVTETRELLVISRN